MPQLPGDLVRGLEVRVVGGRLDVGAAGRARGVDVDRDERLGVVDHDAAAGGQGDRVRVRRLDLALDLEAREQRHVVGVELDLALRVARLEALHVLERALVGARLVDQHLADVVREVVAQRPRDRVALLVDEERRRALARRGDDGVPVGAQVVEVPLQFLGAAADAGGAHDRAHAVRYVQLVERVARHVAILALDAARDAARARVVRHQDQEASREADEGRERRALVAALLLLDLHEELLAFLEHVADVEAGAGRRLEAEIFARDFLERQEALALRAVLDEGGFEARLDARDARLVDVAFFLLAGR